MVDLSKFTSNKKIFSKVVALGSTTNFITKFCPLFFTFNFFFDNIEYINILNLQIHLRKF